MKKKAHPQDHLDLANPDDERHALRLLGRGTIVEMVLSAHLILERRLTAAVSRKLKRPEVLRDQWSFNQKLLLFIGHYDPPELLVQRLRAFNSLRNQIAHKFDGETAAVEKFVSALSATPLKGATTEETLKFGAVALDIDLTEFCDEQDTSV